MPAPAYSYTTFSNATRHGAFTRRDAPDLNERELKPMAEANWEAQRQHYNSHVKDLSTREVGSVSCAARLSTGTQLPS